MKTPALVSFGLALSMATSGMAFGQPRDDQRNDNRNDHRNGSRQESRQDNRQDKRQDRRQDRRQDNRQDNRQDRRQDNYRGYPGSDRMGYRNPPSFQPRHAPPVRYSRGAGPDHNYWPGSRLPQPYRGRQYVVENWRGHHLSAPPRGYHWVQAGADYMLVAIATGVILQLLLNP